MTNSQTTGAIMNLIVESIPKKNVQTDHGAIQQIIDTDFLLYRLMEIDSDNFAAFVHACHSCIDMVESMKSRMPPALWAELKADVDRMIKTDIISVTAKSSENGKLIEQMLRDVSESYHYLKTSGKDKGGLADKLGGIQGDQQQQQQQQQPMRL